MKAYLLGILIWQSNTSVSDREQELSIPQLRFHHQLSAGVLHGFDGVEHEVD
jgi:hypothetical protein